MLRSAIALLHGLLLQLGVYGDDFDIDAYTRTARIVVDGPQ